MSKVTPPRKLVERNVPSGLSVVWKLWRHCLCRNGFYPIIVAPFVTAAFFLDAYTSTGCRFIHLEVGMEPSNTAWNQTEVDLGLFFYRKTSDVTSTNNYLLETFHPECQAYDSVFKDFFIEGDKTWKMSQILAMISSAAGCTATAVVWLMIITPLPSCFIWPGILLPAVLIELLAGCARFLIFDTQICKDRLWVPQGENMQPRRADSCTLSIDSFLSIAVGALSFVSVLMVCLRAPKRRILDENYGMRYKDVDNDMLNLWTHTMDDSACQSNSNDLESQTRNAWNSPAKIQPNSSMDIEGIIRQQMSRDDKNALISSKSKDAKKRQQSKDLTKQKYDPKANIGEINVRKLRESSLPQVHDSDEVQKMPKEQVYTDISDENLSLGLRSIPKSIRSGRSHRSKVLEETNNISKDEASFSSSKVAVAPSDEAACFAFKSPLKAFKDNFSPLKSTKSKKDTWPALEETKAYDESKIMKCIGDLEHSFSQS